MNIIYWRRHGQHDGEIKHNSINLYKIRKLRFKRQRTANDYAVKRRIYKRPDQEKYTLSRHTEFYKADRTT